MSITEKLKDEGNWMPVLFYHALAILPVLVPLYFYRRGGSPSKFFYFFGVFSVAFPDLDHLLIWRGEFLMRIIPLTLEFLIPDFALRVPTDLLLHAWRYLIMAALTYLFSRFLMKKEFLVKYGKYVGIFVLGYGLHLAMDGVIAF